MRDFHLHELNDDEFEDLVASLCDNVLGIGFVTFSAGRDGGRDGAFSGIAREFPSASLPWKGRFIIQAKGSSNPVASCSDADFESKVLKEEIPRIEKLRDAKELDNYILFTNRKLSADTSVKVKVKLAKAAGTGNVEIIGKERITHLLEKFPDIARLHKLNVLTGPLHIRNDDLKQIIEGLVSSGFDITKLPASATSFVYLDSAEKNVLNGLSDEYAKYIRDSSLPYFDRVKSFLEDPINESLRLKYFNLADELKQRVIIAKRDHESFDTLLTSLYDAILDKLPGLTENRKLVSVFIHYMYFNCDIGDKC